MYFVQKKNRCKNLECVSYTSPYLCFATSSSAHTTTKTAENTYADGNSFVNNTTKRGSGGNSYAGYLARKVGHIKCTKNCNVKCTNK